MAETADKTAPIYSVAELNKAVADLLGTSFRLLWVAGEVSNLARPRSGHIYFTLKDDQAQVRCALFKNRAYYVKTALENGAAVRVRARVGLYAARGDYQLIIEHLEDDGAGAAQRAFEQVKQKLNAEGLFDADHKQSLPAVASRIGVITSPTGAAVRDVLRVVARRFPLSAVRIYPVPVQGEQAPSAIIAALGHAHHRGDCDVLIVARGGGSLEDLAAFNDEAVARAIAACPIPVVAGVGHEVDVTIADLVADQRAATPSAAAETVCPDRQAYAQKLDELAKRARGALQKMLAGRTERLDAMATRLARQHPRRRIDHAAQRLDTAGEQLERVVRRRLDDADQRLQSIAARHRRATPQPVVNRWQSRVADLRRRLIETQRRQITGNAQQLAGLSRSLDSLSPLRTLERGYAIARDETGAIVRHAENLRIGDRVDLALAHGRLRCRIDDIDPDEQSVS
ncbi:exodeoxyribonuclease VII large subunit [Salinisphaera sp. USBA-960]|uniref:exodeoxyribonuclease VII large subunit n=1 Tax=Salinisphaera orenii TaxID=856731 RepID=UPI000DBE5B98|nr:exodeoxyribonuclease VII large subunit [Salifodinibacter halophilus]NNC25779.1 exodeoxyribonuclease VII large subunit [Salifodinibacter halophilus]